jgi:sulfur relay protein TusB/DsrH
MLLIIKSAPDTAEGKRAIKLANDMSADICLMQSAVYFSQRERLKGFSGTVYVIDEDRKLRGLKDEEIVPEIRKIDYEGLVELMAEKKKVIGIF